MLNLFQQRLLSFWAFTNSAIARSCRGTNPPPTPPRRGANPPPTPPRRGANQNKNEVTKMSTIKISDPNPARAPTPLLGGVGGGSNLDFPHTT
jgi:hypothetical protein